MFLGQSESSEKEAMEEKKSVEARALTLARLLHFKKTCSVLWSYRIRPRNAAA